MHVFNMFITAVCFIFLKIQIFLNAKTYKNLRIRVTNKNVRWPFA